LRLIWLRMSWLAAACLAAGLALAATGRPSPAATVVSPVTGDLRRGTTVLLDPGHGGRDPGALGSASREADVNLLVALALRAWLERAGARVLMTWSRPGQLSPERNFTVRQRAAWIQATHGDVLLDIHCNSGIAAHGPQVFYSDGAASFRLARLVTAELHDFTGGRRPVERIAQYVLEHAGMPAVNVEVGFINNPADERLLLDPRYRRRLTWSILLGVERWVLESRWPRALDDDPPPPPMVRR
jgi:N-acetylmuramoyl-L-alanine amidase